MANELLTNTAWERAFKLAVENKDVDTALSMLVDCYKTGQMHGTIQGGIAALIGVMIGVGITLSIKWAKHCVNMKNLDEQIEELRRQWDEANAKKKKVKKSEDEK